MKKIILIILVAFYITIFNIESANALTYFEQRTLVNYIKTTCKEYNKPCKVGILNNTDQVQAMTSSAGEIFFTKPLLDKLTYDEAVAVGLHEVGHHVLNHHTKNCSNYAKEFEADKFATYVLLSSGKVNTLPSALRKIVPVKYWNYATVTHPMTTARIKLIEKYQEEYLRWVYD